jgi:DNA-directed RNA polymerase specialized sigma24 family protein
MSRGLPCSGALIQVRFAPSHQGHAGDNPHFGQLPVSEIAFLAGIAGRWGRRQGLMSQTGQTGSGAGSAGDLLDAEEVVAAIDALSAADKLKLREIERFRRRGTDLKEGDLLREAMCATILGDRNCPRRTPMMAFLVQTMRSMAGHYRKKLAREIADGGASQDRAESGAAVVFAAAAPNPEESLIEREGVDTVAAIQACFEGDEEAQMVVLGWSGGYRGKELRDFVGIEQDALDYAAKRIRRAMTKRYPNGWKKP